VSVLSLQRKLQQFCEHLSMDHSKANRFVSAYLTQEHTLDKYTFKHSRVVRVSLLIDGDSLARLGEVRARSNEVNAAMAKVLTPGILSFVRVNKTSFNSSARKESCSFISTANLVRSPDINWLVQIWVWVISNCLFQCYGQNSLDTWQTRKRTALSPAPWCFARYLMSCMHKLSEEE